MARGSLPGERRGGRQKGTPNRASAAKADEIAASGMTPLDYLISVMRVETATPPERLEAAAKAAPYVHPRLSAIEYTGPAEPEEDPDLSELDPEERDQLRKMYERRMKRDTDDNGQPGQDGFGGISATFHRRSLLIADSLRESPFHG
jgi:hypothetical protein